MKSRASLVLMEQLVMILVFALAAALCLQAFARADQLSRETELRDQAVSLAQNGAETLKACSGDFEEAARLLGGTASGNTLAVHYEKIRLEMALLPAQITGLGTAEVNVIDAEAGGVLFALTVGWQEVG